MSLFGFLRKQLIDIVEWNQQDESDLLAWRFPREDNEIKNGAKLIVREGQHAVFVNMGKLADTFAPGMYTLETKNLPILSNLMGWKYGFESPFKADAYFLATRRFVDLKWGTASPITMRDKEFGMVRLRAYGSYAMQVTNPPVFLRELLATDPAFRTYEIAGQLRSTIVTRLSDALASSGIPVLDMASNLDELSQYAQEKLNADFAEMGLSLPIFLVENISLPENVEQALDKRTSMGIIGNLDSYMKFQTAEALQAAAQNPGGGGAGLGAGLGAGMAMAQQMMNVTAPQQQAAAPPPMPGTAPPPLPPSAVFFAAINGQQVGPFDSGVMREQITGGQVRRDTFVWRQGMADWAKAGEVDELRPLFANAPPPIPPA